MPKLPESGAQQVGGLLKNAEGLYDSGKKLQSMYNDVKGGLGGGNTPAPAVAAPPPADVHVPEAQQTPPAASDATPVASLGAAGDVGTAMADASGLADLGDVAAFVANGGRIGRDAGGGLVASTGLPSVRQAPQEAQISNAVAAQNASPTWNGPFAHGGLAGGGSPNTSWINSSPTGPDVVSPTSAYLSGLGEAQAAQVVAIWFLLPIRLTWKRPPLIQIKWPRQKISLPMVRFRQSRTSTQSTT